MLCNSGELSDQCFQFGLKVRLLYSARTGYSAGVSSIRLGLLDAFTQFYFDPESSMRVCFDSLCFASDRLQEDGDDETHCEIVTMSNGKVITSEGMWV